MIYKYPLTDPLPYNQSIQEIGVSTITTASSFLHVAYQRGQLCIWVDVGLDNDGNIQRYGKTKIHIQGTGTEAPHNAEYIGSCQNPNDQCVWHIYVEE